MSFVLQITVWPESVRQEQNPSMEKCDCKVVKCVDLNHHCHRHHRRHHHLIKTKTELEHCTIFFFRDRVSLCSSGCPGTHFVDQTGLKLRNLPASASQVLGLKVCATTTRLQQCFLSSPPPPHQDIKYIEVTSTRSRYLDGPQRCSSPCATPPFGSPRSGSLFLSRDIPRETRSSSNESLIFSGNQGRGPSPLTPSSLSNAIPCRESRTSGSPLATPPGWEKGLRAPQRGSRVSILSASPVSDVSYVFGR